MNELSLCFIMENFVYSTVSFIAKCAYNNPIITIVLSFIMALILIGNVHLSKLLCTTRPQLGYDYGPERGPHSWTVSGSNQSPINIITGMVQFTNIRQPLIWNHYDDIPSAMILENTGTTVVLKAVYSGNAPTISGADLLHSYTFNSLCFRWSFWNSEGSEHTIDGQNYPMEIQALHNAAPVLSCLPTENKVILSYLFKIAAHNQYLDPIVMNLHRIKKPGTVVEISPFPLAWLCYPFRTGFYSYGGSESSPPCSEGVEWFINSEAMSISESQLMEFRYLLSSDGFSRITRNSRPVQCLNNNRTVNCNTYNFSATESSFDNNASEVIDDSEDD